MTGDVVRTLFGGGEPLLVIPKFGLDMVHEPRRSHGRKRQSEAFLYSRFRLTPAEAQIALGIAGGGDIGRGRQRARPQCLDRAV
jgi:hypothetical protein